MLIAALLLSSGYHPSPRSVGCALIRQATAWFTAGRGVPCGDVALAAAYKEAVHAYTAAIDACSSKGCDSTVPVALPLQERQCHAATLLTQRGLQRDGVAADDRERATLHSNRAAAHERLGAFASALRDGLLAVDLAPDWPKAHLRHVRSPEATAMASNNGQLCACLHAADLASHVY